MVGDSAARSMKGICEIAGKFIRGYSSRNAKCIGTASARSGSGWALARAAELDFAPAIHRQTCPQEEKIIEGGDWRVANRARALR